MAEKTVKVPEFLKEPLEAAQARLGVLEEETQRMLKEFLVKGKASRRELADMVGKLRQQDWTVDELKTRVAKLTDQGRHMAAEWRDRARAEAADRLEELQARAIAFLGVASKEQVEDLSRELERLSRKLEKGKKLTRKGARRPQAEV